MRNFEIPEWCWEWYMEQLFDHFEVAVFECPCEGMWWCSHSSLWPNDRDRVARTKQYNYDAPNNSVRLQFFCSISSRSCPPLLIELNVKPYSPLVGVILAPLPFPFILSMFFAVNQSNLRRIGISVKILMIKVWSLKSQHMTNDNPDDGNRN